MRRIKDSARLKFDILDPIHHDQAMLISKIAVLFISLIHFYFMILEMFLWTKPYGLRNFRQSLEKARESEVLAKNQGLYNGFLAAGLVWGAFHPSPDFAFQINLFFLTCVIIAGIYGALTAYKKIFFVQALPALIALSILLLTAN
jgi:putative membrane protein